MRALIQRVSHAECVVDGSVTGACDQGYLVLLGVGDGDTQAQADQLLDKIVNLRIFDDENGKVNLSLADIDGQMLVVSQFTLFADCRKGRRPSFTSAGAPDMAVPLYEYFCERAEELVSHVGRGVFGADMKVTLTNDGPFTIWLDTDELSRPRR
jgi:D-tyrosyl-tRNA(Tyr) deacylase